MNPADAVRLPGDHVLAIAARGALVALVLVVAFASLGPATSLPRLLYSNNLEHFAAFYVLTLVFAAARYGAPVWRILFETAAIATALEAARWLLPGTRQGDFNHWMADLGGILAFGAPLVVISFRRAFGSGDYAG